MKPRHEASGNKGKPSPKSLSRMVVFPLAVAAVYAVVVADSPQRAIVALRTSWHILLQVTPPLCIAFAVMVVLNMLAKPGQIRRFVGKDAGAKGVGISTVAGIVSMGPIYVWHPLLKGLREKGATDFHLACFLSSRAVKPILLPVMVSCFGWAFALIFNALVIVGAVLTGVVVGALNNPAEKA